MSPLLPPSPKTSSNTQYVVAICVMALFAVVLVLGVLVIRPKEDNAGLIAAGLGFLSSITLGLLAFMKAQETHLSVNSRLDAFMKQASELAYQKGVNDTAAAASPATGPAALPQVIAIPPSVGAIEVTKQASTKETQ